MYGKSTALISSQGADTGICGEGTVDGQGASRPLQTWITIQNFRSMSTAVAPKVTILGYDASHVTGVRLDNVVVDDIASGTVMASYADVTLGPGDVNFTPAGAGVNVTNQIAGSSTPDPCTGKWVTF